MPSPAFAKMIIFDWYDGPVGGVLLDSDQGRLFYFRLIDWDSGHRIRVFGLHELPSDARGLVDSVASGPPTWPVWYPREFVHPSETIRAVMLNVARMRMRPDTADFAVAWDVSAQKLIAVRPLSEQEGTMATDWFEAVDTDAGPFDWFRCMSVPRS